MNSLKFIPLLFALLLSVGYAQDGWRRAVGDPVNALSERGEGRPSDESGFTGKTQSFTSFSTSSSEVPSADAVTPYLQSLAEGLGDDPVRIYEWVKNNIDFVPYNGLKRGAHLTAVEKAGNAFDTSALLVALLKAAGYTDVSYKFGFVSMDIERPDGKDAVHWLGVDKSQVAQFLYMAGCNYPGYYGVWGDTAYTTVEVPHIWVNLVIGGTTYVLDASFKQYRLHTPQSLAPVSYSSAALVSAAGGTLANVSGTSSGTSYTLNTAGKNSLRTALGGYAVNLATHAQTTWHDKSGVEIAGGKTLVPEVITSLPTSLPPAVQFSVSTAWEQIPAEFGVQFTLNIGNLSRTWFTAELQGRKLALWFQGGGAQIWLDDTLVATETGYTASTAAPVSFAYAYALNTDLSSSTSADRTLKRVGDGGNPAPCYVVSYGFDHTLGRLQERLRIQADYVSQGLDPYGRQLRTENLYVMALQYLNQLSAMNEIAAAATGQTLYIQDHAGISGQVTAPYVDLPLNIVINWSRNELDTDPSQNFTLSLAKAIHGFLVSAYTLSALEHVTVEQTVPGIGASTTKLIQKSVELGNPVYLARSLADYNVIKNQLTNYPGAGLSAGEVSGIAGFMSGGGIALLPKNHAMAINAYTGSGYMLVDGNYSGARMMISGGLSGGFSTVVNTSFTSTFSNTYWNTNISVTTPSASQSTYSADPVDMGNGSFYHTATDLALGGEAPHGLALSRRYSSARRTYDPTGLGKGWTHSYDIRLSHRSPNDLDFQTMTPAEVAPFIIGFRAINDIFNEAGNARDWSLPALIACWIGDQLVDSRAAIALGEKGFEFTKLPDGTYAPPAGIAASLVKNGDGSHKLTFRKGNEITFRASDGKFTAIADKLNSGGTALTLAATYSGDGKLNRVTDSFGRYFQFNYSGSRLASVADSTGRTVSYATETYQGSSAFAVTDPEGRKSRYLYDSKNRVTQLVDALERTIITSVYDQWDQVIEQRAFGNDSHLWLMGFAPGVGRTRDPLGYDTWFYFDARGRRFAQTNELGKTTRWDYDGADRVLKTTSPLGRVSQATYDRNHEVTSETNNVGHTRTITPASDNSTTTPRTDRNFEGKSVVTTYSSYHKPLTITAPGGIVEEYQYDARGRVYRHHPAAFAPGEWITYTYDDSTGYTKRITATYPDSSTEVTDYDARGNAIQSIDRRGKKSTTTYNLRGQPVRTARWTGTYTAASPVGGTPPSGSLVKDITYDGAGDLLTESIDGKTTGYIHDANGNVTAVWGPDEVLQLDNYYDERNQLAYTFDANSALVTHYYDAAQRRTQTFDSLVRLSEQSYDDDGRPITSTTPRGRTTTDHFNTAGHKATTTDPKSQVITYAYDKDGRLTALTNRRGKTYTTAYDDAGRTVTTATPLGKTTVEVRNTRGLVVTATEPSGESLANTAFDAEGRVLTQVHKDSLGGTVSTTTFTYYAGGLLHTVTETPAVGTARTTTRTYDDLGRLYSYADGEGNTLGYRYDASGNLSQLIYPDAKTISYAYDAYNRLVTVTDWASRVTAYTYDAVGRVTRIDRPNGTARKLFYDLAGQVRQIEERAPGASGAVFWLQNLRYDQTGNNGNFRLNDGEITWTYTYPAPAAFTLPADTATYDDDNRLLTWTPGGGALQNPVFDDDGNLTTGPEALGSSPAPTAYTYDTRNRLVSAGGLAYRYNPEGHRVEVSGVKYVVDPAARLSRVLVRDQGGTPTRYVWGLGLLYEDTGGATKTYHGNHQGSTVALTDDSGTVTDLVEYAPYGSVTHRTGTSDTPFLLHGALGVMTEANGLVYMRARYYHPRLMRFLNADPIGFGGGMNWYAFAGNNPVGWADPSGHVRESNGGYTYSSVAGTGLHQSSRFAPSPNFSAPSNAVSQSIWTGAGTAALDSGGRYAGAVIETFKVWQWPQAIADFAGTNLASAIYQPSDYFNPTSKTNVDYLKWQFGTAEGYGNLAGIGLTGSVIPNLPRPQLPTVKVSPAAKLIIINTIDAISDGTILGRLPDPKTATPPMPPPAIIHVIDSKPVLGAGSGGNL